MTRPAIFIFLSFIFLTDILIAQGVIQSNDDFYVKTLNNPFFMDVVANDDPGDCGTTSPVIVHNPVNGIANIENNEIMYTSNTGFIGIDSLTYSITCNGIISESKAYIVVIKPLSQQYQACQGSIIDIGMENISDVSYYWYDSMSGGNLISSSNNIITLTKNASPIQTVYVEARYKGMAFPRIQIGLIMANNCGEVMPGGCAANGKLLFKEDFGGGNASDPRVSSNPLDPTLTDYPFSDENLETNHPVGMKYWILKKNINKYGAYNISKQIWHTDFSDATFPDDTTRGYMLMVEAGRQPLKIYEHSITGLCPDLKLFFSVSLTNMSVKLRNIFGLTDDPNIKLELLDENGNILTTYATGKIPRDSLNDFKWRLYGFEFIVPPGITTVKLKVSNLYNSGWQQNAFAMDNIEIRLCTPPVIITSPLDNNVVACSDTTLFFSGNFKDNGTFGNNLIYRWEYSITGAEGEWNAINGTEGTSSTGYFSSNYIISNLTGQNEGFYRLVVANSSTIDEDDICRAVSDIISLRINESPYFTVISDTITCTSVLNLLSMVGDLSDNSIIRFYKDPQATDSLVSTTVIMVSDTTYYVKAENIMTGCSSSIEEIRIDLQENPVVENTIGNRRCCIDNIIHLHNPTAQGGVWEVSDPSVLRIENSTINTATIKALSTGRAYVSFTVGLSCKTTDTHEIKVVPEDDLIIIIGF